MTSSRSAPSGSTGRDVRVLVVEGEATALKALVLLLARAGYDALGTGAIEEALASLEVERFDAVVIDLDLPGTRWKEVVALATRGDAAPRIVGISARRTTPPPRELADLDARLTKPLELPRLYALLGPGAIGTDR